MKKKIIYGLKYWGQALLLPLYWFSLITPRSKNIWLLGSTFGRRFADNPRYFYHYINQFKKDEVRAIWITHNKQIVEFLKENKLEGYYYKSLRGIWYCLRAKVYIFDNYSKDISFWLSGGAIKINLWHGTGNKKINYDNKFDTIRHPKNSWEKFKYYLRRLSDEKPSHFILATSEMMGDIFASAFQVPRNHIIIDGYPRNDVLFENNSLTIIYSEQEEELIKEIKKYKSEGYLIILYMPTFRESESMFFDVINLNTFNNFLKENKFLFYTKLHPKSKLKEQFAGLNYSNIINIDGEIDSYTILRYTDLLTTDYSSVHTDFLMLNRPSVLFTYDLEEYSKDSRECYFEYDDYIPELRTYTMEEFMSGILKVLKKDDYEIRRIELRNKMFHYVDSNSSKRLYQKIKNLL